jgi:hypothetical protein
MEETNKFVKNTMATKLHENDESFNNDEVEVFGDELERWMRSCGTFQGGQWPDEAVDTLDAWLEFFLPQAESLKQLATELSAGLSQEEGREAWATLESEVAAVCRASGGSDSPVGSEAAGSFAFLAEVLEKRLLRVRGWKSALLAWRAAASAGRSRR